MKKIWLFPIVSVATALTLGLLTLPTVAANLVPKTILISLDGATPWLLNSYLDSGIINPNQGIGLLRNQGIVAQQNITCTPSLTAACHIAIGTGANTNNTDVPANTYHLVRSPFSSNISGFGGPIGGYDALNPDPKESPSPTAIPIWQPLLAAGKTVVAATFPGADGVNVTVPGFPGNPIVQPGTERTVSYTVPYGAFNGPGTQGVALNASDFSPASSNVLSQLAAAGITSFSPVKVANVSSITLNGTPKNIQAAAIATNSSTPNNYDSLVFFDAQQGIIKPGSLPLPATGSAIVSANTSSPFYLGTNSSGGQVGTGFYVSSLASDLSTVHIAQYSANYIPTNTNVASSVNDVNNHVGFWANEPDFRIPERLAPGFSSFSTQELEAIYQNQLQTFVQYQTNVALRAINQNPNADLVLAYIEQPDGAEHQFLITDPRQATDPSNPNSILGGQDQAKIARYQSYVKDAYLAANNAVQSIINQVGLDSNGKPNSNIIVVSDHGFAPFYTAVNLKNYLDNYLSSRGFDPSKVRAVTSGPAANIYINLQGREPNGTVSQAEYLTLQQQIIAALQALVDQNPNYAPNGPVNVFDKLYSRPAVLGDSNFGLETNNIIGQDFGDVFAIMTEGYNFDGTQSPAVTRKGDASSNIFSVPNFYGAHGYDPTLSNMSAIFYAAGPDIGHGTIPLVHNIDIAPTINQLLGVASAATVQGKPISVPEPSGNTAITLFGLSLLGLKFKKQRQRS